MLTDEDLVRELEVAFRDESNGLTYAGRVPVPRRPVVPWTAVPIAAATAAVIVLPQLGSGSGPTATPPGPAQTITPKVDATFSAQPGGTSTKPRIKLVTASFEFAGRTFSYQKPAGEPDRYVVYTLGGAEPPAAATPVPHPYDIERAWSGTDPKTGDAAVWVQDSRYFDNQYVEMTSPSFTEQELVTMLQTPPDQ